MSDKKGRNKAGRPKGSGKVKAKITLRLPDRMKSGLEQMVDFQGGDISEQVRVAIREYLQRHQLWPESPVQPEQKSN